MYGIYRQSRSSSAPAHLVASCRTKRGAERACRHLYRVYANQTGTSSYDVKYEKIDSYLFLKLGYKVLCFQRWNETRKLGKLSGEAYIAQQQKIAELY